VRALVHNLMSARFEHSDCFIRSGYLREQFLPFFFGIEPNEYYDFISLCRRGSAALRAGDFVQVAAIDEMFANRYWQWAAGHTLDGYIALQLAGVSSRLTGIRSSKVALIARTVWRVVDAACAARGDRTQDHVVLAMRPHIAVARAARTATP
jgi:hypothetical protein